MKNTYDIDKYGGREGLLKVGRRALSFFDSKKYGDLSKFLEEVTEDDGKINREEKNTNTYKILNQLIPDGKEILPETKMQIESIIKIFYFLGEYLVDLYIGFADHIHKKFIELQKRDKEVKIIFDGRDSLGFFNVYIKKYGKENVMFCKNNRGSVFSYSPGIDHPETQNLENERIINFYKQNNLLNKTLLFVDSGFNGTLPRIHQAILQDNGFSSPQINIELLVYYDDHQNIREMIAENFTDKKIYENNEKIKNNINGYMNNILGKNGEELKKIDPFRKTIQELSAYIIEARADGLIQYKERPENDKKTDFSLDSIQNIAAKYNFMKGLMSVDIKNYTTSEDEIKKRITVFKYLYSEYFDIFGCLQDRAEKRLFDKEIEELSDTIYTLLIENNLRQVVG